jgi:hypothetical protein
MAFIVATKPGRFEVRESVSTPKGPRSRTLASLSELTPEVIEKARRRAKRSFDEAALREAALRVGAPVAEPPVDRAARETLRLLARGKRLDPMLRRLLADALGDEERYDRPRDPEALVSAEARSASEWAGADSGERAEALRQLLELADALPVRRRHPEIGFPRLRSA